MDCVFSGDTCTRCGVPSRWPQQPRNCRPGLGDYVHAGLAAVGITPERVAAALGVEDCGCHQRQQLLNELGRAIGIGTVDGSGTMTQEVADGKAET
jgi:hypothetical protein